MDPVRFLAALRARLRQSLVVEGVARVLAIALAGLVVAVAADWLWHLPGAVRLALLAGVLAAAALVAWVRLIRPFRNDLGDAALARFAERRVPGLDGRLLTRVEGIALGPSDERALALTLGGIDPRTLVPARRTPRQLLVSGGAAAVVVLAAVLAPQLSWDGARRLLLPLGGTEWSRHTQLTARLEKPVAPADGALVVVVGRSHPSAGFSAPVEVAWRSGARVEEVRQLQGLTGSAWNTAIAGPPGEYEITVTSGDAPPVVLSGRIINRPSLARIAAELTPPPYTGLPVQRSGTLAGTVVPGTVVRFAVGFATDPGREVTSASATFDGQAIELGTDSGGLRIGSFTVLKAGTLGLTGSDQDGIGLAGEARFPLTITPDRPPVVSLAGPLPRESVSVRAVVGLTVAASDDFGLGQLGLRRRTVKGDPDKPADKGGADQPKAEAKADDSSEAERFTGVAGQPSATRQTTVTVASYAAEGEQLVLTARATDRNDVSGPGVGDSEPVILRVVAEDVLRQELDRLLGEARDRVAQARDELAGAGEPARRTAGLRSAGQGAGKAAELVAQVVRRWDENRFPADGIAPGRKAGTVLTDGALPHLAEAGAAPDAPLAAADADLAEAERLLASILQEGDLTRQLTSLIARQTALNTESRGFVRAFLTKTLDPTGKALQANLAARQREIADQVLELERRLLAKEGGAWTAAQAIVRQDAPGDQLRQASQDLATTDRRPRAVDGQQASLAALGKLLDALRGGDANKDLAAKVGKLAAEQEALARELERGASPGTLAAQQKDLAERTQAAQREAQAKDPAAAKALAAAVAAQQSAAGGMANGDAASSTRDANAAAGLLREAQKGLDGQKDQPKKPDEDKKQVDILALLKELRTLQAALVTDATLLHQVAGERPLAFDTQRQVLALARTQSDLQLRLNEEAIKPLDQNPIAKLALDRVASAMAVAQAHLAKPALGAKGMRLTRQALAELSRLIEVAEDMPRPDKKEDKGGGGEGGGQAPQAPFPKQAEIALLAAMQQELAAKTAGGHPGDLAGGQAELQHLVELMAGTARPDTRPAVLLERARRAMTSAAFQLKQQDRGALTRNEQHAAEAALRRLLAEAGGGGGGGGGGKSGGGKPPPQQSGGGQPPSGQGDPGDPGQAQAPPPTGGERQPGKPGGEALPVQAVTTDPNLMELPEQIREQIREAREQHFTPGQLQVYQRYLELLEEGR